MNDNLYGDRKKQLEEFNKLIMKKENKFGPVDIPKGLFVKCEVCGSAIYHKILKSKLYVCPYCDNHFRINADDRIESLVDANSFKEIDKNITSFNPLNMEGYETKLDNYIKLTENLEAFKSGLATIMGYKVAIGVLDSTFMMGSMGSAVGEKVTNLIELATKEELPLIIVSASGGARMQEGILSLMQMAKTSAALARHSEKNLLYISVLTNPTTGGVAASFATLGDINIAEKSSLIGFAGARVIKQTIGQELPKGFQTDQFQLNYGHIDLISKRINLRNLIGKLLKLHGVTNL
ncbi:MAG TPA: acetyl-CoA carboxylase, carboxyltransferase subunit beta [Acholeplasmataceae bacterium]|nr:acetyl-CoA carboxylase, carboxyltransferase subunit beta [Acholeplasmataceae bacterium]